MDELLPLLPTLVHLARSGSISRTARELGVPRSTISRRVARIEAALGVAVAERTTRHFRLTAAGRTLVEGSGRLLGELRSLQEEVQTQAGAVSGRLRVAAPPGFGGPFLAPFLREFQATFPQVVVELVVTERRPHLLEEDFDLVLTSGPLEDAPWICHLLGESALLLVASPGYLAQGGVPGDVDELGDHRLLSPTLEGISPLHWPLLDGSSVRVLPRFTTNDLQTLRSAVLDGMGICLFPAHLVAEDLASGALVAVLPTRVGRPLQIWALFTPERRSSPLLRALLDRVASFAAAAR